MATKYGCLIMTFVLFLIVPDYLLSNNHINSIIVHKFDFSDEEVCRCCLYYLFFNGYIIQALFGGLDYFCLDEVGVTMLYR